MKKIIKYLILPVIMLFVCINNVDAFDKICNYSIETTAGTFKYRVIISGLDDAMLTSKEARDAMWSARWDDHVYPTFYDYNTEKYDSDLTGCIAANREKFKTADEKICILTKNQTTARRTFFEKGLDGNGGFNCPSLYQLKDTRNKLISVVADKSQSEDGKSISDSTGEIDFSDVNIEISNEDMECSEILGSNLTNIVHLCITILRIAGAIITLVKATLVLVPAISSGDAGALKKAGKTCVLLAIILLIIGLLPTILNFIGLIGDFDLSCLA